MRWRGDRVALYPVSFEYDLTGENGHIIVSPPASKKSKRAYCFRSDYVIQR